ncbi:L-threonylcarbamoyladenylate synthase [Nocardia sp. NPDC020380]|uniref:L-threonylcarbamoyladenylate synthase n=1 Tax=Nocardia sp. NPDC020380 TaxID=3364309 RepID=UPI0037A10159
MSLGRRGPRVRAPSPVCMLAGRGGCECGPSKSRAVVSRRFDCSLDAERAAGLRAACEAVRRGGVVALPTDTVYGVGADAFNPDAVAGVLRAKRRGRDKPSPVLIGARADLAVRRISPADRLRTLRPPRSASRALDR